MRQVNIQLNKGEWLHDLRKFLLFAPEGQIRKSQIRDRSIRQPASLFSQCGDSMEHSLYTGSGKAASIRRVRVEE